ncbi:MAG: hypothetical protein HY319_15585 [Armatimonadetes bacterium]|nr:hypothetical protein [Armatimonadota bacterium]
MATRQGVDGLLGSPDEILEWCADYNFLRILIDERVVSEFWLFVVPESRPLRGPSG